MDKYDQQIAYLTEHPAEIKEHWKMGIGLFQYMGATDNDQRTAFCGCLTMIRHESRRYTAIGRKKILTDFTRRIKEDQRLPSKSDDISVTHLPAFADYQREMDALYPKRFKTDQLHTYLNP